jgi:hypothetical protein
LLEEVGALEDTKQGSLLLALLGLFRAHHIPNRADARADLAQQLPTLVHAARPFHTGSWSHSRWRHVVLCMHAGATLAATTGRSHLQNCQAGS